MNLTKLELAKKIVASMDDNTYPMYTIPLRGPHRLKDQDNWSREQAAEYLAKNNDKNWLQHWHDAIYKK